MPADEFILITSLKSYILEMPDFVDEFWEKIFAVLEELGITGLDPSKLVFKSDRVDRWHLRKTQENVDKFFHLCCFVAQEFAGMYAWVSFGPEFWCKSLYHSLLESNCSSLSTALV